MYIHALLIFYDVTVKILAVHLASFPGFVVLRPLESDKAWERS